MLIIKSFHIITMVCWFAGLFYLPRLFVYHSDKNNFGSNECFKQMEYRLYYYIIWPAAMLTIMLGLWLFGYNYHYYISAGWMHLKLILVLILFGYQLCCGHFLQKFALNKNDCTTGFYRWFNEIPTLLLITIVFLVVVKPF